MKYKNHKFDLIMRFLELVKVQPKWNISELCKMLDIENIDFEYIVSTLSEIYISNDFDLFIDIEIIQNEINIEFAYPTVRRYNDKIESKCKILEPPLLVAKASGTTVVIKEKQNN